VKAVKMVRHYKDSNGRTASQLYQVRKDKVLKALGWLQKHNREYLKIEIKKENLKWMNGKKKADLSGVVNIETNSDKQQEDEDFTNEGVSKTQCSHAATGFEEEYEESGLAQ
jgi:hypothetical protein